MRKLTFFRLPRRVGLVMEGYKFGRAACEGAA